MIGPTTLTVPMEGTNDKKRKQPRQRTEKKKIQDRLAQRANRERTKQRIATLEEALKSLKSGDDPNYTTSLMRTNANLRSNNHRLRYTLGKMHSLISQLALLPEEESANNDGEFRPWACSTEAKSSESQLPTSLITEPELAIFERDPDEPTTTRGSRTTSVAGTIDSGSRHTPEDNALENDVYDENDLVEDVPEEDLFEIFADTALAHDNTVEKRGGKQFDFDLQNNNIYDVFDQADLSAWPACGSQLFNLRHPIIEVTGGVVPDIEKWYAGNSAYFGAIDSVKRKVKSATTMDFQVALQAVSSGWQTVGREAEHPVWTALRQVDQKIFGNWTSKAQRIAMMYVCQTLIQYRENPGPENLSRVPGFLRPRPGMRDRLVFEHEKYNATGVFSAAYVDNFTFFWPYSDSDIFRYDPLLDRYELCPLFLQYVYNYKNWKMKAGFFERCPEMRYDVPAFEDTGFIMGPATPLTRTEC
ncbi:hypothetical protein H2200_004155 [Cladophialophora chaetospira]|uniref:BZIP domain-containing protein n=1 Tax=Cladophialophora chaetospira TaxID=386627 RepID=A0AA39CLT9_9EURO|nr:hypothetical protein H2200_004155 [Cladophialophora chaetospira]